MRICSVWYRMSAMASIPEYESSITFIVSKDDYNRVFNILQNKPSVMHHDFLFYYNTPKQVRLSGRKFEEKVTTSCENILGIYENKLFPITRTNAIETLTQIPTILIPYKVRSRKFIFIDDDTDKIRISCITDETEMGIKYKISAEIEYCSTEYGDFLISENKLMGHLYDILDEVYSHPSSDLLFSNFFSFNTLSLQDIFACIPPKLQMWHCFDPSNCYLWAYKWDGIKAKAVVEGDTIRLWPDAQDVSIKRCTGSGLSVLNNLCLQIEIMENQYILTDLIAISYCNKIYSSESLSNVLFLHYALSILKDVKIDGKPLVVQQYYNPPMAKTYNTDLYDGFVIAQKSLLIKWKLPTIDAKCISSVATRNGKIKSTFVVGDNNTINITHNYVLVTDGCICEITADDKILRIRHDRTTYSTQQEWGVFIESVKLLSQ